MILLRVAAGGATRADLQRDVAPLLAPRLTGIQFRQSAELAISALLGGQKLSETKGRLTVTTRGSQVAQASIASSRGIAVAWTDAKWPDVKTALLLRALSAADTPGIRKALQRPEGLAALVLQCHFGKSLARVLSPADLRAELAIIALEKAFGNKIKTGFGKGAGLPAKAGRVLAGQLFKQPREVATDGKLVVALACDVAGSREPTLEALELAILRNLFAPPLVEEEPPPPKQRADRVPRQLRPAPPEPANDSSPLKDAPQPLFRPAAPPDLSEFCQAVLAAARPIAEGWPGNRKAFISLVWKAIRYARPDWGLSEPAFKGMLTEAHRSGHIELATADLKDGRDLKSLEDSKIIYKNTVWHFVRVQD